MDIMEARRSILMAQDQELPPLYKRVEYIRAKTNAYIETNYVPTRYDEFHVKFLIEGQNNTSRGLFSAGTGTYQLVFLANVSSNYSYLRYFNNDAPAYRFYMSGDAWQDLSLSSGGTLTIGSYSNSYTYQNEIDGNSNNLYILRRRNGNNPFVGKLKSFKIINNSTLKMNMIPCIRASDSKAGMYDTVSKQFYSSSSTEEFTPSTLDT